MLLIPEDISSVSLVVFFYCVISRYFFLLACTLFLCFARHTSTSCLPLAWQASGQGCETGQQFRLHNRVAFQVRTPSVLTQSLHYYLLPGTGLCGDTTAWQKGQQLRGAPSRFESGLEQHAVEGWKRGARSQQKRFWN